MPINATKRIEAVAPENSRPSNKTETPPSTSWCLARLVTQYQNNIANNARGVGVTVAAARATLGVAPSGAPVVNEPMKSAKQRQHDQAARTIQKAHRAFAETVAAKKEAATARGSQSLFVKTRYGEEGDKAKQRTYHVFRDPEVAKALDDMPTVLALPGRLEQKKLLGQGANNKVYAGPQPATVIRHSQHSHWSRN